MSGGLGNQMFQYALVKNLLSMGKEVKVDDVTEYEHQAETGIRRPLMLEKAFGIRYERATKEEILAVRNAGGSLFAKIARRLSGQKKQSYQDRDFVFDRRFLERDEGYFMGCFQSAKYFEDIAGEIKTIYAFPDDLFKDHPAIGEFASQIDKQEESVSIHLRFGDYLTKEETYGGICTDAYYEAAIRLIRRKTRTPHFFIFSNDVDRAGEWLSQRMTNGTLRPEEVTLVFGNDEDDGYLDLALMRRCKHHILANSSFSWWGAYLADKKGKITIAPSYWIHEKDGSEVARGDIYTREMIRISPAGKTLAEKPLVSVIVAAYNIEDYIGRALNTLRAQTYPQMEILVVDDGSTDSTGGICDAFAVLDRRIRVIHKENGGLSDARNAGLKEATGEYIAYLDGDDYVHPLMIEGMISALILSDAKLAVIRYKNVSEEGEEDIFAEDGMTIERVLRRTRLLSGEEAMERYLLDDGKTIIYNSVWSKLFHRSVVEDLRFPVGKNSEDILYTTKALLRSDRVAYLDVPLYAYVTDRENSIMNQNRGNRRMEDEIPFWKEQIALLKEEGKEEAADKAAYAFYKRMLYYDLDFREAEGMESFAARLEDMMQDEKEEIRRVYQNPFVANGDKKRMELFLKSPAQYETWAKRYEKYVVPLKRKMRSRKTGR